MASIFVPRGFAALVAIMALGRVPAEAQLVRITHQNWDEITAATGTNHMNRPRALSFEAPDGGGNIIKKILVGWTRETDNTIWPYDNGWCASVNGGMSYGAPVTTPNIDLMTSFKRRDGTLIAVPFYPKYPATLPNTQFTFTYHVSTNQGVNWTEYAYNHATNGGIVNFPVTSWGMRFHRGIIEENNGDLYAPVYVRFSTDPTFRTALVKSTDGGRVWNYHCVIAQTDTSIYNESTIARCVNGDWLMVVRRDEEQLPATNPPTFLAQQLKQRRSSNLGVSWSNIIDTPGLVADGTDPHLMLMPNGIMVLSYGHSLTNGASRHMRLAFSNDGNGTSWSNIVETFTSVVGDESSGYTAAVPVSAHRFIQVGDTGHAWSYGSTVPSPNPFSTQQKVVDLTMARRNRIDLKGLYDAVGSSIMATDLTYSNAATPEARPTGAFDGSTDYWSGAFKSGASGVSGTYTIDLQRNHSINAIGVCLHYHNAQSASIDVATNAGGPWTTKKTYSNATHHAINYTDLTPFTARYVRVTVTAPVGQTKVSLNELELYTVAQTFENDGQNTVPYLFDPPVPLTPSKFWVSEGVVELPTGYQSKRALYMNDTTTTDATITQTWSTTTTKTLEFMLKPKAYATNPSGAIQWRLLSGSTIAFRFRVISGGQIQWYNGTTYTNISGAFAPIDTWTRIKVVATATANDDTASLYVNEALKGALNSIGSENDVANMNKLQFASGGGLANGDRALFDDVSMN